MPEPSWRASAGRLLGHIAAAAAFVVVAVGWSFPLARHLSTHLPGPSAGDNFNFLWNFWWMRTSLASGLDFFHTMYVFVPTGTDLTLHTHTALPAFLGATVLGAAPVIAALNLTILGGLFLNGFCTYLLAWRVTRDQGAAVVGGIVFGGSPYIAAHLNGHFNLTMAWTIPLFAITISEAIRGSAGWAVLAGLVFGVTAYIDYYYVVYEAALGLCIVALTARKWSVAPRRPSRVAHRLAKVACFLILVDIAVIATIVITGGFNAKIGPIQISAHELFNPLQALWLLVALFIWLRLRLRVDVQRRETCPPRRVGRAVMIMAAVFSAVAAPLVWNGVGLLIRGEYVSQRYLWRSAPKGLDLATLVLGNPFHSLWGEGVQRIYHTLGIGLIDSTGWLGIAPVVLAARALRRHVGAAKLRNLGQTSMSADPTTLTAGQWATIGLVFFVWALGPHLMAFGVNTGMILPQVLLRYLPIVGNARIPGRAIVVSYLALAVLAAIALADWRRESRHAFLILVVVSLVVTADYLPAPFPLVAVDRPAIYTLLRDRREVGAVCELPLGVRDGFGERGSFDDRVLFYQTIHQRPLVGGFVARLPKTVAAAYEDDPLLVALLRLSEREGAVDTTRPLPDRELATSRLRENGIAFVVLNRSTALPALVEYVNRVLPLTLVAEEGNRSLYLVSR